MRRMTRTRVSSSGIARERRHHHADALRLHLCGREHKIPDALYQSCRRTGIRIEPARIGHIRTAELILLGTPFDARRAVELGLVNQVTSDKDVLAKARETAEKLATKPAAALQAGKRLIKQPFREQIRAAMKAENEEFSVQVRSEDAKEAFTAFLEKRKPDFARNIKSQATA
jgi:hypothetical protein